MNILDQDSSKGLKSGRPVANRPQVKYLLFKGGVKVDSFNSFYEAYQYGISQFNNGFLVHKSTDL